MQQIQMAIKQLLDPSLPVASMEAYVCGPRGMINECVKTLQHIGLPKQQIHYESWW